MLPGVRFVLAMRRYAKILFAVVQGALRNDVIDDHSIGTLHNGPVHGELHGSNSVIAFGAIGPLSAPSVSRELGVIFRVDNGHLPVRERNMSDRWIGWLRDFWTNITLSTHGTHRTRKGVLVYG
jgi:hypothetical protein